MAWSAPRTWVEAENVTAALLNTHLRDQLIALKDPPSANYVLNEGSDYTTVSTTFGDVDGTNLALQITTTGGDVFVHFHGTCKQATGGHKVNFDVDVDGVRHGGDDGIVAQHDLGGDVAVVSFTRLITGLSAASHTFKLQWKVTGGTGTLYAGAGTVGFDFHPQFWVREMS